MFTAAEILDMIRVLTDRHKQTTIELVNSQIETFAKSTVPRLVNEIWERELPKIVDEVGTRMAVELLRLDPDKREALLNDWAAGKRI